MCDPNYRPYNVTLCYKTPGFLYLIKLEVPALISVCVCNVKVQLQSYKSRECHQLVVLPVNICHDLFINCCIPDSFHCTVWPENQVTHDNG